MYQISLKDPRGGSPTPDYVQHFISKKLAENDYQRNKNAKNYLILSLVKYNDKDNI